MFMRVSIIIPAYNEEKRIKDTLQAYDQFLSNKRHGADFDYELLVVINGTTDNTPGVIRSLQPSMPALLMVEIKNGGKGLAIAHGFKEALKRSNDLIGFVDADMATSPSAFYELIAHINGYDGIIASRYTKGAVVTPARPLIKRWGSKLFFESLTRLLFRIKYDDTQCGAKLFKRNVIQKIAPHLSVPQWAFDIEILYLCKRFGFIIKEFPTVWHDKAGSKLRILRAGSRMLGTLFLLRFRYWTNRVR
jgi:glycosyltransferase involved in cell wall biosynthesis